jgi:hypothetical protein
MRRKRLEVRVLVVLLAAACSSPTATPPVGLTPPANNANGYPGLEVAPPTGYPPPGATTGPVGASFATPPAAPAEAPPPETGRASISGLLFAPASVGVIRGTDFFLRPLPPDATDQPALFTPPDAAAGDVIARTNLDGEFEMTSIQPGEYHLYVWAPYDWRPARVGANSTEMLVIRLADGQRLALGVVYVDWP